jgi:hypothetical protein
MSKYPSKEAMDKYLRETIDRLGPPTHEQMIQVSAIISRARGETPRPFYPDPSEGGRMREQARKDEELRRVRAYARDVMGCEGCGLPPEAHTRSAGLHEWEARKDILKLAEGS